MRFFYRVRTNEPCAQHEEVPEVPLRRSNSISERKTASGCKAADATQIATSSASSSSSVSSLSSTSSLDNSNSRPESPATPDVKVKSDAQTPKSVSFADNCGRRDGKSSSKVKTPKSDDRLAKQLARSAKRLSKEASAEAPVEKRVENIKLKIDQNSVTIIKNSTKELKLKFKKERDHKNTSVSSPASSPSSSSSSSSGSNTRNTKSIETEATPSVKRKSGDIASIKLAKVHTSDRSGSKSPGSSDIVKYEIKSPVTETATPLVPVASTSRAASVVSAAKSAAIVPPPAPVIEVNLDSVKTEELDDIYEEKKSEFLNSFELTPTKLLPPLKLQQIDAQIRQNQLSPKTFAELKLRKTPPMLASGATTTPTSPTTSKATAATAAVGRRSSPTAQSQTARQTTADKKSPSPPLAATTRKAPTPPLAAAASNDVFKVPLPLPLRSTESAAALKRKHKDAIKATTTQSASASAPPPPKRGRISSPELPNALPIAPSQRNGAPGLINTKLNALPEISVTSAPVSNAPASSSKKTTSPPLGKTRRDSIAEPLPLRPPNEQRPITAKDVLPKPPQVPIRNYDGEKKMNNLSVKPIDKLMPPASLKPAPIVNHISRPNQSDTPRPLASTASNKAAQSTAQQQQQQQHRNGTASASKKLPNLLPKPPATSASSHAVSTSNTMGPPLHPISSGKEAANKHPHSIKPAGSSSPAYVPSYPTMGPPVSIPSLHNNNFPHHHHLQHHHHQQPQLKQNGGNTSGYLNFALMNSHKRATSAAADAAAASAMATLGNRTPNPYASGNNSGGGNLPSYAPSSPHYATNYGAGSASGSGTNSASGGPSNYGQFKYMKTPPHLANIFPHPPVNVAQQQQQQQSSKSAATTNASRTPSTTTTAANNQQQQQQQQSNNQNRNTFKRPSVTLTTKDISPPEKQQKVQSLLDSCNISFPSSLSITLHDQKDASAGGSLFQSLHKGPVNNYIEIVKLPDVPLPQAQQDNANNGKQSASPASPPKKQQTPSQAPIQPPVVTPPQKQQVSISSNNASNIMNYVNVMTSTSASASSPMGANKTASAGNKTTAHGNKPRPSPEKKSLPDLNPIDKLAALKERVSFQEKFINSLDHQTANRKSNAPAAATASAAAAGAAGAAGKSKTKPPPRAIAPKTTSPPSSTGGNVAAVAQQLRANATAQIPATTAATSASTKNGPQQRNRNAKAKSPSPPVAANASAAAARNANNSAISPRTTSTAKHAELAALDLTAATPILRQLQQHQQHQQQQQHMNNNNEQNKRNKSPYQLSPTSVSDLNAQLQQAQHQHQAAAAQQQQQQQQNKDLAAAFFAAAMARATQTAAAAATPSFMLPPSMAAAAAQQAALNSYAAGNMQFQQQQFHLFEQFARMQSGQDQLAEALRSNYSKVMVAAAAAAATTAAAAAGSPGTASSANSSSRTPASSPKAAAPTNAATVSPKSKAS